MTKKLPAQLVEGEWVRVPHLNRLRLVEWAREAGSPPSLPAPVVLVCTSGGSVWVLDPACEVEAYCGVEAARVALEESGVRSALGRHYNPARDGFED